MRTVISSVIHRFSRYLALLIPSRQPWAVPSGRGRRGAIVDDSFQSIFRKNRDWRHSRTYVSPGLVAMFRRDGNGGASSGHCRNDYIQSWLEKTQRRPEWEPRTEHTQDEDVPWRPHDLGAVDMAMPSRPPNLRKRRRSSFDSSIIPDQPRRSERRTLATALSNKPSTARAHRDRDSRRRHPRSATVSPAPRQDGTGPFGKRARHKTRPDRYETKKRKNTVDGDAKQKAKRTKTPGKKKLVSSREVMDNFTSDAILTDGRLTVSDDCPGLFHIM